MPVVRRDNDYRVDVPVIKELAIVHIGGDFLVTGLKFLGLHIQKLRICIAKGNDANTRHPAKYVNVLFSLFAKADDSDANIVVCSEDLR